MPMLESTERIREGGGTTPEDLATEFLALRFGGEPAEEADYLARLATDAERAEFKDLVAAAGQVERGLPRAIVGGVLLAGRYRILEPIGSGGMGRVFSAVDEKLGCHVAVKILDPLAQGNREREDLFRKESRLLADLKHPGIVAVHDAGRDGAYTFIVMDLVEGTSLSDVLDRARSELVLDTRRDRLPPRDGALLTRAIGRKASAGRTDIIDPKNWYRSCARILLEITRTLEAAHGKKVVHRDLKPANVMLVGGGNPIVLDFGLAGSPDLTTGGVTESLYGSVCYLAPEQATSQRVGMDPRTDVYQLGLILYEMLTLRRAFPGNAIGEVLRRIESGYYEAPRRVDPRVPRDLQAICACALELSPGDRYSGAKELREDLERWLDGGAPIASRSARWRTLVRTARYTAKRHPVMSAAAAVVLAALGVAAFSWGRGVDPMVSLRPLRYDPVKQRTTFLSEEGENLVHPNEWLGAKVDSNHETFLYVFSWFGRPGEERRVAPWKAFFPEDPDRKNRPKESWGLRVPAREVSGSRIVLGTEVMPDSEPGNYEGLIVLASHVERPEIEQWMSVLSGDSEGLVFSQAREVLDLQMGTTRGVPPKHSFTEEERRSFLGANRSRQDGPTLGLPGVEEHRVECRVAQPQSDPK